MKKLVVVLLMVGSGLVLAEDAKLKPGLWEVKIVHQVMDGRDMTAQMAADQDRMQHAMANLTPEQRKQMQAAMGGKKMPAQGSGGANRVCISAAMAAKNNAAVDPNGRCEPAKVDRSGNTSSFEFNCTSNGRKSVGKGKSTISGNTVTTSVQMTMTDAKGTHTMQSDSQLTYLGADCQGVQPADELARSAQGQAR